MKLMIAFILLGFSNIGMAADRYQVDTKKSVVGWHATKLSGEHNGTVQVKDGWVEMDGDKLLKGEFSIEMSTINNLDIKDPKWNKKLVKHLKADDFFHVSKFPVSIFKIKSVTAQKDGDQLVKGDLTIRGITKEMSFPAKIINGKNSVQAKAKLEFDRTIFDIKYHSKKFFDPKKLGDKLINDKIDFTFDLVAEKTVKKKKKSKS